MILEVVHMSEMIIKNNIKHCEGKHVQQVIYSTYHEALTQICFGCKKVRTSIPKRFANSVKDGVKE